MSSNETQAVVDHCLSEKEKANLHKRGISPTESMEFNFKASAITDERGTSYIAIPSGGFEASDGKKYIPFSLSLADVSYGGNPFSSVMSEHGTTMFLGKPLVEQAQKGLVSVLFLLLKSIGSTVSDEETLDRRLFNAYFEELEVAKSVYSGGNRNRSGISALPMMMSTYMNVDDITNTESLIRSVAICAANATKLCRRNKSMLKLGMYSPYRKRTSDKKFCHVFLEMMSCKGQSVENVRIFSQALALHISHGVNLSEGTAFSVGSGHGTVIQSTLSGLLALFTPRHGYACDKVVAQHNQMVGMSTEEKAAFLKRATIIYGCGHRVIKGEDDVRYSAIMDYLSNVFPDAYNVIQENSDLAKQAMYDLKGIEFGRNIDMATGALYQELGISLEKDVATFLFGVARVGGLVGMALYGQSLPIMRGRDLASSWITTLDQ